MAGVTVPPGAGQRDPLSSPWEAQRRMSGLRMHARQRRPRHLLIDIRFEVRGPNCQDHSERELHRNPPSGPPVFGSRPADEGQTAELAGGAGEPLVATTIRIPRVLKLRAESAVLTTTGRTGGYNSLTSFIAGAISHELVRLATDLNEGRPFAPNSGPFRIGRPAGRGRG